MNSFNTVVSVFDRRVSVNDITIGTKLYPVFSVTGSCAVQSKEITVASFPYVSKYTQSLFFDYTCILDFGTALKSVRQRKIETRTMASLDDNNVRAGDSLPTYVPSNQYNFHAFFATQEDADAYCNAINVGQIPPELKDVRDRLIEERQHDRELDYWDY